MTQPLYLAPVDALPGIAPSTLAQTTSSVAPGGAGATNSFGEMVTRGLQQTSEQLLDSQAGLQTAAAGGTENLHQLMIRLEEARMSFQLMLQVRNRLLESYQELMRTQV